MSTLFYPLRKHKLFMFFVMPCMLFYSCLIGQSNISYPSGNYKSKKYSLVETINLKIKGESYLSGNTLHLLKDSNCEYSTCAQIIRAKWWVNGDSLFVKCLSKQFLKDSFNQLDEFSEGRKCASYPMVFKIKKDGLVRKIIMANGFTAIDYLIIDKVAK